MEDLKVPTEVTQKVISNIADSGKPTERKSWKEVIEKAKGIIEETKKAPNNDPWEDKFDRRDEICKKIQHLFNFKLNAIHSQPEIKALIDSGKFRVNKTVGVRLFDGMHNSNQKEYVTKEFLNYAPLISNEQFNKIATSLGHKCDAIEKDLNSAKNRYKELKKELGVVKSKIGQIEAKYTKEKGTDLTARDLDNDLDLSKLREEKYKLEETIDRLASIIGNGETTLSDLKQIKLNVKTHDVTITEPIIASRLLIHIIGIFSHNVDELDDKCKEIATDPILDQEVTDELIKSIIEKNCIDSMSTTYLNIKQQENVKDSLVYELLAKYLSDEGFKDVKELFEEAEKLNCVSDVQMEILDHLYDNPNESVDEMGALIRKKDENGKQVPLSNEDLNSIGLLKVFVSQFTFNGDIYQSLHAMKSFEEGNGELYFPVYKRDIEPYAKVLLQNIESEDKRKLMLLFILLACFKINTISLLFLLLTDFAPAEPKVEEGSPE